MTRDHLSQPTNLGSDVDRYQALFRLVQAGIAVMNNRGYIQDANPAFERLLGYSREELTEVRLDDLVSKQDRSRIATLATSAIQSGTHHLDAEMRLRTRNGEEIWVHLSTTFLRDERGLIAGGITIAQDLEERKLVQAELLRVEKLESLALLAGGIAHDFNNTLTALMGSVSLAQMESHDSALVEQRLDLALRAANQARALTEQLLTFAKGGMPIRASACIVDLLHETAALSLQGSNVGYTLEAPDSVWFGDFDRGQVNQVFTNILINADQSMPDGGMIRISVDNCDLSEGTTLPLEAGRYLRVAVTDTGRGIPKKHLSRIFDPFFTTKNLGSGLGLATSFSVIHRHGGHIQVKSVVEEGTTFTVYLPASAEAPPVEVPRNLFETLERHRILVMDDEEFVREIIARMLEKLGQEAVTTENGAQALSAWKEAKESSQPFDLAIMDLTIPGAMGGVEAIHELLAMDPSARAVVSSGYSSSPVLSQFEEYGFVGRVSKPYSLKELYAVLKSVL